MKSVETYKKKFLNVEIYFNKSEKKTIAYCVWTKLYV